MCDWKFYIILHHLIEKMLHHDQNRIINVHEQLSLQIRLLQTLLCTCILNEYMHESAHGYVFHWTLVLSNVVKFFYLIMRMHFIIVLLSYSSWRRMSALLVDIRSRASSGECRHWFTSETPMIDSSILHCCIKETLTGSAIVAETNTLELFDLLKCWCIDLLCWCACATYKTCSVQG